MVFVLGLQGLAFLTPRWIWKQWEQGQIKSLTQNASKEPEKVGQYLDESFGQNSSYAYGQ